jgi:dTDP-4-amino-4,6-dideoxygalactose transaminase
MSGPASGLKKSRHSMSRHTTGEGSPLVPERFRFIRPTLPPLSRVLALYERAYADGLVTNGGLVRRFEDAVAERLGVKHCVAVSSCTCGLALVFKALDIRGEVILPSLTFFATGHALLWNGLKPVFADCDPATWTLDPADVESRITRRTAAILAVHLYGNPCDTEPLEGIARRHGIKLVFDAAHAFGSRHNGRPVGGFGDAEVFSLSPTKLLVAGEGGLVTTNDAVLANRLRAGRNYGDLGNYDPELLGLNARMTEYSAALGLAGLEILDQKVRRYNELAARYTRQLATLRGLTFQKIRAGDVSTFKDYSIVVDARAFGIGRDELARRLLEENIETKKYFHPPLHELKLYRRFHGRGRAGLPNTGRISTGVLSLPIYDALPEETIDAVALAIRSATH